MKREGYQHGIVKTGFWPKTSWKFDESETPTTAGEFTRVSTKPNNHSKSSGLPAGYRTHPGRKSIHKVKGCNKVIRSSYKLDLSAANVINYHSGDEDSVDSGYDYRSD